MKRVFIIEALTDVKVNVPNGAYTEKAKIGRYIVHAIFLPNDNFVYVFRGDELKAIISKDDWYISRLDGEGQNLLNKLLKIYGGLTIVPHFFLYNKTTIAIQ